MFKNKKAQKEKRRFSIKFDRGIKKAEEIVKKDIDIVKQDIKRFETPQSLDFFITYGWAILVIIIGIIGFIWWNYYSIGSEKCEFVEGHGLLCKNFDITNESLNIEIRNLNNKTIAINQITLKSCFINPEQNIPSNDRRSFNIPCNISSGRLKEKIVVAYTIEDFQKHAVAKIAKIVP